MGDQSLALRALERAFTAYDYAWPLTERVWTGFFTAGRLGSLTVATYAKLQHPDTDSAARSLLAALSPTENKVRAIVLAELALTAAKQADYDRADEISRAALPLATRTETSLAVDRLWDLVDLLGNVEDGAVVQMRDRLATSLVD